MHKDKSMPLNARESLRHNSPWLQESSLYNTTFLFTWYRWAQLEKQTSKQTNMMPIVVCPSSARFAASKSNSISMTRPVAGSGRELCH